MSVSMKSTKAQMYAEIEFLRELCNSMEMQLRDQCEEIERLRALCDLQEQQLRDASQSRQDRQARQARQAPELSERRAKLEILKSFATKFRCSARLRDGVIELYCKERGCWVAAPEGVQT